MQNLQIETTIFEIFLGERSLCYIIESIDKIGKVSDAHKALRMMSDGS
jgi:hypothetical protein